MLMTDEVASSTPVATQAFIAIGGGEIWQFLMNDEPEIVKRHNNRNDNEGNGSIQIIKHSILFCFCGNGNGNLATI